MAMISQAQLVEDLGRIFPEFPSYWSDEVVSDDFPSQSLHAVYMALVPFLGGVDSTQSQLRLLADLFSREVAAGGDRQNAVDTCVLEHLHQIGLNKAIRPLLSQVAKTFVRA